MTEFPHLRAAVFNTPWAIMEDRLMAIVEVIERRISGVRLSADEVANIKGGRQHNGVLELLSFSDPLTPLAAGPQNSPAGTGAVIAVINVMGIIAQHASQVDDISGPGGTSTDRLGASFRSAIADPNVKAIVLNIDSPGGSVNGVQAVADEIYRSRGKKPIVAQVNSLAASAAYWIASAADEIVMTPGAQAGSIGVYATHKDVSVAAEKEGVKVTFISAGKYKTEGHPFSPLDSEAASAMQLQVDAYYVDFVNGVARGRGVSAEDVRSGYGQGRVLKDKMAIKEGLADRIDTMDGTLKRLSSPRSSRAAKALSTSPTPTDAAAIMLTKHVTEDGGTVISMDRDWPQKIALHGAMIEHDTSVFAYDENSKTFTWNVSNGIAVYRLVSVDAYGFFVAELVECSRTPREEEKAEQSAEDRDAFRRRRHAARSRSMSLVR